jgi:hypothetical protein
MAIRVPVFISTKTDGSLPFCTKVLLRTNAVPRRSAKFVQSTAAFTTRICENANGREIRGRNVMGQNLHGVFAFITPRGVDSDVRC